MSIQNNNSLLIKSVSQSNRFLNTNLTNLNGIAMSNNNSRKMPKSMSNFSSSNLSVNSYSNYTNSTQSQTYLPSMIKNMPVTNANKKYSTDYQQAVRYDYADAFINNNNIDFLNRISQMQRLQMETVEWERKKRMSKKKSNNQSVPNNNLTSKTNNPGSTGNNLLINQTNLND